MSIAEPNFILAAKDGAFELRDYAETIVAEATVSGDHHEAGSKGFRLLAGYIFGGNHGGAKIAMTAPVTQISGEGDWLVRFTMPAQYAMADLPVPNDPQVALKALPATRLAVLRFSGLAGEAKVKDATAKLLDIVRARGLVPVGPTSLSRYNPPWTLWFMRRNEVMVPVAMS